MWVSLFFFSVLFPLFFLFFAFQIVREYWPEFQAELANHGKTLPTYAINELDSFSQF